MSVKSIFVFLLFAACCYYVFFVKGISFGNNVDGDITLYALDNKVVTLNDIAGENGSFIFYMGTWCHYCSQEVTDLITIHKTLREKGIRVIICISGRDLEEIERWKNKFDFPWDWKLIYWDVELYKKFKIKRNFVPYLTARNIKGEIVPCKPGLLRPEELLKVADEMLESNKQ